MTQYFGSLSRTAQEAVENLVQQMTGSSKRGARRSYFGPNPGTSGAAHAPGSSRFGRGRYEPDVEQIRRRGEQ
jgi:hypothetical protein